MIRRAFVLNLHRLCTSDSILVIIDPQARLLLKMYEHERATANIILLIRLALAMNIPILVTTQYAKGIGPIADDILAELPNAQRFIDKVEFGCFENERFLAEVESLRGRNTAILAGIESHICVSLTAIGALGKKYQVHVASDAISSRTKRNWRVGLGRMRDAGAVISSSEMIAYELLSRSDSAAFKTLLPLLKQSAG